MENRGWLVLLKGEVRRHGQAAVVKKTGLSKATISQLINGKYPAGTDNVKKTILGVYGRGRHVMCPVLEQIAIEQCLEHWEVALRIGVRCGNPATMRLYNNCKKCELLGGNEQ